MLVSHLASLNSCFEVADHDFTSLVSVSSCRLTRWCNRFIIIFWPSSYWIERGCEWNRHHLLGIWQVIRCNDKVQSSCCEVSYILIHIWRTWSLLTYLSVKLSFARHSTWWRLALFFLQWCWWHMHYYRTALAKFTSTESSLSLSASTCSTCEECWHHSSVRRVPDVETAI